MYYNTSEDYIEIIHAARKRRRCAEYKNNCKKIYLLSSGSIQYFGMVLEYFLYEHGISVRVVEGSYDGIRAEILDEESALYKEKPDILVVLPYYRDILAYPEPFMEEEKLNQLEEDTIETFKILWDNVNKIENISVFWGNYAIPYERQFSNLDQIKSSKKSFLRQINDRLFQAAPSNVNILDLEYLSSLVGKENWFDYKDYYLHKSTVSPMYLPLIAETVSKSIECSLGRVKKCLVLDLDNTLWGGVVAETGYDGITIDQNTPLGEAYYDFQRYIKALSQRGIILAICSKNDKEVAMEPFEKNPNMFLKLSDITVFYANWQDKVTNIKHIAEELNIGTDSMVFFDDNPAERKLVREYLPMVQVIEVPEDPADYVKVLEKASPFEVLEITKEDMGRTDSYVNNQKRKLLEQSSVNYDSYLKELSMIGLCKEIDKTDIPRFVQLINKSNQFNLRTQRYNQEQIEHLYQENDSCLLKIELSDIFTNYGIISCIIMKKNGTDCFLDTWVMSCRVLKRKVEIFAFGKIVEYAKKMGCTSITGEYIRTEKNKLTEDLFPSLGFVVMGKHEDTTVYKLDIEHVQIEHGPIQEKNDQIK